MSLRLPVAAALVSISLAVACGGGDTNAPQITAESNVDFTRYVAIGNSVSMGWADDGVVSTSQETSWPKQLATAAGAGAAFTQPLLATPGCQPPLAAPLASFKRMDGSSAATSSQMCANDVAGTTLPTSNLAIEGALAMDAIGETPETPRGRERPILSRVLPAGKSQVTAMLMKNPTFVTVDFGGNEILPVQVGILAPGATYVPFDNFRAAYSAIIDSVKKSGAKALLVGLPWDIRQFPTLRTGAEIASQRAAFAAFNVSVNTDCDNSPNYVFVRGKVLTAVGTAAAYAAAGAGPYNLSCADVPGTPDYILTPADIGNVNNLLSQMNNEITARAAANGYAMSTLNDLYARSKDGVAFSLQSFLMGSSPYGSLISLDGVHPTAAGQKILANSAVIAINARYGSSLRQLQ